MCELFPVIMVATSNDELQDCCANSLKNAAEPEAERDYDFQSRRIKYGCAVRRPNGSRGDFDLGAAQQNAQRVLQFVGCQRLGKKCHRAGREAVRHAFQTLVGSH
jgi:hypothetical protein